MDENRTSLERIVVVEPEEGDLHPTARFARGVDTTIGNRLTVLRDTPLYATILKEIGFGLAETTLSVLVGTLLGRAFYGYEEGYPAGAMQGAVMGVTKTAWRSLNAYYKVKQLRQTGYPEIEAKEREYLFEIRERLFRQEKWFYRPNATIDDQGKEEYRLEEVLKNSLPGLGFAIPFFAIKGLTWKTALSSLAIEGLTSCLKEMYRLFSDARTEQQLQENVEVQRTANQDGSINAEYAVIHGGAPPERVSALVRYQPIPLTPAALSKQIYEAGLEVDPYLHTRNGEDLEPADIREYEPTQDIEYDGGLTSPIKLLPSRTERNED